MEEIVETIYTQELSPSPYSDHEKSISTSTKNKIYRLFEREKLVHKILGGGKAADVFLWRYSTTGSKILKQIKSGDVIKIANLVNGQDHIMFPSEYG